MSNLPPSDHSPGPATIGISLGLLVISGFLLILFTRTPSRKQPQTVSELLTHPQMAATGTSHTESQHQTQAPPETSGAQVSSQVHLGATVDELTQLLGKPSQVSQNFQTAGAKTLQFGNQITWLKRPDPAWSIIATCIAGRCLRITYQHGEGRITDDQIRFLTARNGLNHLTWTADKLNGTLIARWTAENGTTIVLDQTRPTVEITLPAFGEAVEVLKAEQAGRASQLPKF